jgi:hypothetical protein
MQPSIKEPRRRKQMLRISKDDTRITGSFERIYGVASIADFDADGEPNWEGGTDVDWDSQVTVTRNGERVWVDEDGDEYLDSETRLMTEEEFNALSEGDE